ncbi:hypothetical protein XM38_049790 [Halomicronema hongdechloris C2206]|uniref:Uncharacterized protein n=1 Tax=Halomicronema hongdechloris C2206 TaxID=1641165 RepID=A0A1Z3HUQ3_9CYAN|nr:hypothetical protein [Halomicronema hongdechloris]ASC74005.1 hypothetical protein XM38_049790 [Halomicronema hongdechloris C2206]
MGPSDSSQPRSQRSWKRLYYPLILLSILLHGLLLVAPLPSQPDPAEEEEETETEDEAEVVDLLSISSLVSEEPPPPEPATPQPTAAPPPQTTRPAAPRQPVVPDTYPPEPVTRDPATSAPAENAGLVAPTAPESNFTIDPQRQNQALQGVTVMGRTGSSNFNITDLFPVAAWGKGLNNLPSGDRRCFFSSISQNNYALVDGAIDLLYISRNIELVEREDLVQSFEPKGYTLVPSEQDYCNHPLIEVQEAGQPLLYVSLIDLKGTTIVIFWSTNPLNA